MSFKYKLLGETLFLLLVLPKITSADAFCGMPDPKSSLEEHIYSVAFISAILPMLNSEYGEMRESAIEEYIESIFELKSIVHVFSSCFKKEELFRASQALRLVAAAMKYYPVEKVLLNPRISELLQEETDRDLLDYREMELFLNKTYASSS